jgi:DNA primase (bacterial type)
VDESAKYIIRATIAANGVVERSDVVGAIFGQTEGLLGKELDLRDLQDSSKVGRIDVDIESENGQSFGDVLVSSSLDRVETAILGASLETITRVGPCRATIEVDRIEDVRAAKRRQVVDRARELLSDSFDESVLSSDEIRQAVAESDVADIAHYSDLPAGPRVKDSDAVIVVEGRADVAQLLQHGIKNAIAVEGTNVPDAVARLSKERTVTAFLDGDRGGELILQELTQVGDIEYVAFAPDRESVEDLSRDRLLDALRAKVSIDSIADVADARSVVATEREKMATTADTTASDSGSASVGDPQPPSDGDTDSVSGSGSETDADGPDDPITQAIDSAETNSANGAQSSSTATEATTETDSSTMSSSQSDVKTTATASASNSVTTDQSHSEPEQNGSTGATGQEDASVHDESAGAETGDATGADTPPDAAAGGLDDPEQAAGADTDPDDETNAAEVSSSRSLLGHVSDVIDDNNGTDTARLLDEGGTIVSEVNTDEVFETLRDSDDPPSIVVLDGVVNQRLLDVAAQQGVSEIVAREEGDFVKQPLGTRIRTVADLRAEV